MVFIMVIRLFLPILLGSALIITNDSPAIKISIFSICFRSHLRPLLSVAKELSTRSDVELTFTINGECEDYIRGLNFNMHVETVPTSADYTKFPTTISEMGGYFSKVEKDMAKYYITSWNLQENRPDIILSDFCTQAAHDLSEIFSIKQAVIFPHLYAYEGGADRSFIDAYTSFASIYHVDRPSDYSLVRAVWILLKSWGYGISNLIMVQDRNAVRAELGLGPVWTLSGKNTELPYVTFIETFYDLVQPVVLPPYIEFVGPIIFDMSMGIEDGEIEEWIGNSKGFVYVSFGTLLEFTETQVEIFQEFFRNSRYDFLVVSKVFKTQLKNVKVVENTNQLRVLSSGNILALISHGGHGGISEAIAKQVPILCMPQGKDQFHSCDRVDEIGIGKMIKPHQISLERIDNDLQEIVTSPRYRTNVERASKILSTYGGAKRVADQVVLYAQVGYDHLFPSWYYLPWYKRNDLDIYVLLASVIFVVAALFKNLWVMHGLKKKLD